MLTLPAAFMAVLAEFCISHDCSCLQEATILKAIMDNCYIFQSTLPAPHGVLCLLEM